MFETALAMAAAELLDGATVIHGDDFYLQTTWPQTRAHLLVRGH
ncbi:hypothetical protein ACFPIJ_43260 [Dactylosporangium cerinum]|uniref:Uncharacterized protein n=1 Tax=Dactylosporangium cerinum TaxID=1434730 RepID=A0ABV9W9C2_9ACTN